MQIIDIVKRVAAPAPWSEGDKIPWNEPQFSERMLREHLSQDHDLASRRLETIDEHVRWVHERLLGSKTARILDLGCGPGLYANALAKLGHLCVGIDFSPASIRHAAEQAKQEQLPSAFIHNDVRQADFGKDFDLVMFLYGELNVFRPADAAAIQKKAHNALRSGGTLLLEPHRFTAVEQTGMQGSTWHSAEAGLFSEQPHLWLQENTWDATSRAAVTRWFIIDAVTGSVQQMTQTMQAYTDQEYRELLAATGFVGIEFHPGLGGSTNDSESPLMAITAKRQGA